MLWNKVIYMIFKFTLKVFALEVSVCKLHNLNKLWIVNKLGNPNFFLVKLRNECIYVNHEVREHLYISFLTLNKYVRNCRVLKLISKLCSNNSTFLTDNLSCRSIHHILCKRMSYDTVAEGKLFVKLVAAYLCKVIALWIKKHVVYVV